MALEDVCVLVDERRAEDPELGRHVDQPVREDLAEVLKEEVRFAHLVRLLGTPLQGLDLHLLFIYIYYIFLCMHPSLKVSFPLKFY